MFLIKAFKAVLVLYDLALISTFLVIGMRGVDSRIDLLFLILLIPEALYFTLSSASKITRIKALADLNAHLFALSFVAASFLLFLNFWDKPLSSSLLFALPILPLPLYFWGTAAEYLIRIGWNPRRQEERKLAGAGAVKLLTAATVSDRHEHLAAEPPEAEREAEEVSDPKRRDFLKKAGAAGLGLLAYSLLNPKQAGAAFFGSVPGPGTVAIKDTADVKIDPAIKDLQSLTTSYGISEIDEADPAYYGFVNKSGAWYILRAEADSSYRYTKGAGSFNTNWDGRSGLNYKFFDEAFE